MFWRQVSCNENTYKKLIQCLCLAKSITPLWMCQTTRNSENGQVCAKLILREITARLLAQVVLPSPILAQRRADGFLMVSLGKRVGEDHGCGRAFGRRRKQSVSRECCGLISELEIFFFGVEEVHIHSL